MHQPFRAAGVWAASVCALYSGALKAGRPVVGWKWPSHPQLSFSDAPFNNSKCFAPRGLRSIFPLEWLTFSGSQDIRNLLSTAACLGWYGGLERHLFIPFWRPLLPSRWGYFLPKWLLSGNHMGRDGQVSNVTMQIAVSNPNQGLKCQTLNVPPIHVFPATNLPQK